jgi:hypothetical protein
MAGYGLAKFWGTVWGTLLAAYESGSPAETITQSQLYVKFPRVNYLDGLNLSAVKVALKIP